MKQIHLIKLFNNSIMENGKTKTSVNTYIFNHDLK